MAQKKVYIGSAGPVIYDDTNDLNDSDFVGVKRAAIVTNGIIVAAGITSDGSEIVKKSELPIVFLGTSREITITHDGENKTLTFSLPELYDDVRVPATAVQGGGVKDPDFGSVLPAGNLRTWRFDKNVVEELFFVVQFPHSFKEGSTIYPHIHWMPVDTDTGSVVWGLEYSWADVNGTFQAPPVVTYTTIAPVTMLTTLAPTTAAPTTPPVDSDVIYTTDAADGVAWKHQVTSFSPIDGAEFGISSMLVCRIFRAANSPHDTYDADAALLEFDIHIVKDAAGSLNEFTK